ncbi:methyl-accepting chemotaxis protein [Oceanicola sp. 502str15]|uniref:methyl-accepting chemotaxis protein n=1 Tax=Oceanicola sp. 502str15 TaxID=2696061 RepID=UPI002095FFCF|nr:methyl-accepting chemotaxis protein [Oceanicola sp. 502str15]MCO6381206.1 methyl-accepting chemotaxis protein [Oceanicola sp. 502str15]
MPEHEPLLLTADQALDPSVDHALEAARASAVRMLSRITPLLWLLAVAAEWLMGGNIMVMGLAGGAFTLLGLAAPRLAPQAARILVAQALTGLTISLNAALAGHPMQIDSHMAYFAVLAMLVALADIKPLLIAAGTIALHHLALTFALPALVYPSTDLIFNIGRTVFHAVIVVAETSVLTLTILNRISLSREASDKANESLAATALAEESGAKARQEAMRANEALARAEAQSQEAAKARAEAEQALNEVEQRATEAAEAEAREATAAAERTEALATLLEVFRQKLARLSEGDLSVRVTEDLGEDFADLADHFNGAGERLCGAMNAVISQAASINEQSRELTASATDLSTRTEKQAGTLAQIAATLKELTRTIEVVANESRDARKQAENTSSEASEGTGIMSEAVEAMNRIEGSSREIFKITSVIDDIAFQTNLLALNAGVEAARAGEAGRGFAVVASEVRALAQRSSDAAREINGLISNSVSEISGGAALVKNTGTALEGIQSSVTGIVERLRSIAEATTDQSRGLSEVNEAVSNLERVTQQNAGMFEETTAANAMLSGSADELNALMKGFTLGQGDEPPQAIPVMPHLRAAS